MVIGGSKGTPKRKAFRCRACPGFTFNAGKICKECLDANRTPVKPTVSPKQVARLERSDVVTVATTKRDDRTLAVYYAVCRHPGGTDREIAYRLGMPLSEVTEILAWLSRRTGGNRDYKAMDGQPLLVCTNGRWRQNHGAFRGGSVKDLVVTPKRKAKAK